MRLSRANIPLASEDRTHSQAIYTSPHNNLAPHFLPGFINLQHFRHSRWRNPVRLSKMGLTAATNASRNQGGRPLAKRKLSTRQMLIASPVIGAAPRKRLWRLGECRAVRDRPVARVARRHIASDNRGEAVSLREPRRAGSRI